MDYTQQDIFQFSDKPQVDGSIPVLKNGKNSICIKSPLVPVPDKYVASKFDLIRFACNDRCPFLAKIGREIDGKMEYRYALQCSEQNIIIEILEANSNNLTIVK